MSNTQNAPKIDLDKIILRHGGHGAPLTKDENAQACALEWVSILAGEEKFSDHPQCACPVIAAFVRSWNDGFGTSTEADAKRTEMLRPILPLLLNTRIENDKVKLRRAYLALDWTIRVFTPAFLRVANLNEHADGIASHPEIDCMKQLQSVSPRASAAESAAYSAAYSAARSAAYSAAYSALKQTVHDLQVSAQDLVKRMCAVTVESVETWDWNNGVAQ